MEPVVFNPEVRDSSSPTSTESVGQTAVSAQKELPAEPIKIEEKDAIQVLPSLEIPVGTKGKHQKSHAVKTFIKTLVLVYIILTAFGVTVVIFAK